MRKMVRNRVLSLLLILGLLLGAGGYPAFASMGESPDRFSAPAFSGGVLLSSGPGASSSSGLTSGSAWTSNPEDEIPMDDIDEGEVPDMDGSDGTSPVSLTLMDSPGTIKVGEDITISYVLKNSERKINWKSSDPTVATVDENGRVEGRSAGQVEITASVDQVARSLHIRIEKPDATAIHIVSNSISSLDAANKVYELETEMTMRLQIVTDPEDGQHPDLTWESSDPFTGNVDASGLFTAKGVGDVTITARAGTLTDAVTFKIRSAGMDPNVLLRYILIAFGGFMVLILIIVLVALSIRRKKARVEAEERARRAAQRRKEAERMTRKKGQETRIREEGYQRGTMDKEREMSDRMTRVFDPSVLGGGRRQPPAPRPPERPPRPEPPEQPFSIDDIE